VAWCAGACSTAWAGVSGKPPRVPLDAVRMARKKMWVTHAKAARELGFSPAPAEQALSRAVEWFCGAGYLAAHLAAGPRPANLPSA
jgi:dihydroflavonol-4-reductase